MHPLKIAPEVLLDSIYNGIVAIDGNGAIIYFNKTAERIFNLPAQEALNRFILDVLPNTGGKLLECLKTGSPFHGEKLKGETLTLIANIHPLMDEKPIGAISVFQDISEIESISKDLDLFKNLKNWLDAIIDSSYDGLWICDGEGKVVRINKSSERISKIKAEEVVGKNVRDLIAEGFFKRSVTLDVLEKGTSVTIIQETRDGKKVLSTGNPIFNETGEITFVVTNIRDITELDSLRSQLQETQALARGYISKLSELEMKEVDLSYIIFRSEEMEKVLEMALRVADVNSTVLLLGESGVGKGMIARWIHKNSSRSSGPFIRVDCAGVPDTLVESELFGYEKGAFTGARSEGKPGFFELANRGTLFLDEIGEIPLSTQSKLLRFLEDHEIVRVGGSESKRIDVRIIAATNKRIDEMVSSKRFREDLYYRLNVVPIHIAPLRERRDDISPLIFHFLERFNKTHRKEKVLSPEVVDALSKFDFPGNIRELANLIERLVVVAGKDRIELRDLPDCVTNYMSKTMAHTLLSEEIPLKEALREYEKLIIETAMQKHASQDEVAKILKVDQGTISRKIKKYSFAKKDAIIHK